MPRWHLAACPVGSLPTFGPTPLNRIEPHAVRTSIARPDRRGLSPSRIRQTYQLLNAIMKSAVENQLISRSPSIGITLPKVQPREMRFLDTDEVARLANAIQNPYPALVYT